MSGFTTCTLRAHKEKGNAANVAFGNQIDHWSGLSFNFFRCRRLISPCMAVMMNCEVLSPGSFTSSIASTTSCGTRDFNDCDFAFTVPVAISGLRSFRWTTLYSKKTLCELLTWTTPSYIVGHTNRRRTSVIAVPKTVCGSSKAPNHNVSWSNIMACSHDTQTRPEFTYLFLGTPSDKPDTTPVVLRAEANTEQQARSHFLNWNLVFAAQIRTKAPCRLHLIDGGDYFSWLYEQRFDTCTSGVQEVAHG